MPKTDFLENFFKSFGGLKNNVELHEKIGEQEFYASKISYPFPS